MTTATERRDPLVDRSVTRPELIARALRERYPCAALPPGAMTDLAAEFGVSRQRVQQIAKNIGVSGTKGSRNARPVHICASCGEPMSRGVKSLMCRACKWITVSCDGCGVDIQRLASDLVRQVGQIKDTPYGGATYTGRSFCTKSCFGSWAARNYGWGTANNPSRWRKAAK